MNCIGCIRIEPIPGGASFGGIRKMTDGIERTNDTNAERVPAKDDYRQHPSRKRNGRTGGHKKIITGGNR